MNTIQLTTLSIQFIIQADFITQANRQDIIDSPRNRHLRSGVAGTFQKAVFEFCKHPTLVYQWIEYFPDEFNPDPFWKDLRAEIISCLRDTPILRSQSEKTLYKPAQLRFIVHDFRDREGNPLFEDLHDREIYLSRGYDRADQNILRWLGVKDLNFHEALDRVEADLSDPQSRIKGDSMSDAWHVKVAVYLSHEFKKNYLPGRERLKNLPIIPLQTGEWVSAQSSLIYFLDDGYAPIPPDIGLNLVPLSATRICARLQLFEDLGVPTCPEGKVVEQIYLMCSRADWTPENPHTHLNYLFENLPDDAEDVKTKVWLLNDNSEKVWLSRTGKERMYFEEFGIPYGPGELLRYKPAKYSGNPNLQLPAGVHFIHPLYIGKDSNQIRRNARSFEMWLEEVMGVQSFLPIAHHLGHGLSEEFWHIIKHCPNILVSALREHWEEYKPFVSKYEIRYILKNTRVPVEGSAELIALSDTYVPLPKLKNILVRAGVDPGPLFLKLPYELEDEEEEDWEFLEEFGVGVCDDARFHLHVLSKQAASVDCSIGEDQIFPLYREIAKRCDLGKDNKELLR